MTDYGYSEAYHEGVRLTCRNIAPGLTLHDVALAFERGKSEAKPGDEVAGDPSRWPTMRGLIAVVDIISNAFASGTLTEGGDVEQAPGDSLSGPALEEGDAHE